ncbi:MAG TPA: glutathione peroxidase [Acidisoma sp.]|jgi:glutathione peroxidase|nr:glutathione peroxidase [Acidisoma sp.]
MAETVYDFSLRTLQGRPFPLSDLRGRPLLIVNTASQCGFTPQYAALQALQAKWGEQENGLVILGVPSNDFGQQEPGESAAIGTFCERNYGVTFPMMQKAHVKGAAADPLFRWLARQAGFFGRPRWNFYKYLIRRDGTLADWFPSMTAPDSPKITRAVERVLAP